MKAGFFAFVLLILSAVTVSAQQVPETIVSWDLEVFASGVNTATGSPIYGPLNFLRSTSTCGQAKVTVPSIVINPSIISVDDPADTTKACHLGPNSAGVLISAPLGTGLRATLRAKGATLSSPRSAASNPFDRSVVPVAPVVPTGVALLP
jgi:hypothetical protein